MGITKSKLDLFLKLAGDRLAGDWVILGGSVIPLSGLDYRVTNDIDLCGPDSATQKDTVLLMEIAEKIDLPVEAINQAGAFFLKKIIGWKDQIVLVHKGKKANFFRPNTTLYLLLKIPRFSESDLEDCLKMLTLFPKELNTKVIKKRILVEKMETSTQKLARLNELEKMIRPIK